MNKKIFIFAGMFLISFALLIGSVSALGVSSPYYRDNPLKMSPGENVSFSVAIVNSAGTTPVSVRADITSGSDIASIVDSSNVYTADAGGGATVNIKISAPLDSAGKKYTIVASFATVGTSSEGTLAIGTAMDISIPVEISGEMKEEKPTGLSKSTIYLIISIVIVLALILFFSKKKKR